LPQHLCRPRPTIHDVRRHRSRNLPRKLRSSIPGPASDRRGGGGFRCLPRRFHDASAGRWMSNR
jgi:hypothetical protein